MGAAPFAVFKGYGFKVEIRQELNGECWRARKIPILVRRGGQEWASRPTLWLQIVLS